MHIFLRILVKNTFNGLSVSEQTSIIKQIPMTSNSMLAIIGLEQICQVDQQQGKLICDQLSDQTETILENFYTSQNSDSYHQLVREKIFVTLVDEPQIMIKLYNLYILVQSPITSVNKSHSSHEATEPEICKTNNGNRRKM